MDPDYPDLDPESLDVLNSLQEGYDEEEEEDSGVSLNGMGDYHLKSALRSYTDMMKHPIFKKEFSKAVINFGISHDSMMSQIETMFYILKSTPLSMHLGTLYGDLFTRQSTLGHSEDVFDIIQAEIRTLHPHLLLEMTPAKVEEMILIADRKTYDERAASAFWSTLITIKNYIPAWTEKGACTLDWPSVSLDKKSGYVKVMAGKDTTIYIGTDICVIEKYPTVKWAPLSYLLNGADKVAERLNVRYYSCLCDQLDIPDRITLDMLDEIIKVGDDCLREMGNDGYNVIGSYEALLAGIIQRRDNQGLIPDRDLLWRTTMEEFTSSPGRKYLEEWSTMFSSLSPEQIACAHGLYRIWGHPIVDILGGIKKMQEVASVKKNPRQSVLDEIRRQFKEMFFTSYHRIHKHYPLHTILNSLDNSYILNCLKDNLTINTSAISYNFQDWDCVMVEKNFEVPFSWNLVHNLKDKAISPNRQEIYQTISTRGTIFGSQNRRGILKSLTMETVQLRDFLQGINDNGLDDIDKIIGVYPKERELKIKARLFSLMSFRLRLYCVSTEALLGDKILKYFPQITMSLDMLTMIKKMFKVSSQTTREDDSVTVIFNLDFIKWNLQMRRNICEPVFSQLGKLFGMENLFNRTHETFRDSLIYLCSGEGVLSADPVYGVFPDGTWAWAGDESGKEGLRQKGWTILTVVTIMLIAKRHNVDVSLMGGGDNQVLGITISGVTRDLQGELITESASLARRTIKQFTEDLLTTFSDLGLPLKASETWVSDSLFMYNKHMFYKGIPLRSPLKAISRIFPLANDTIMTIDNMINNISSGVKAACMKERHGIPLVFMKTLAYRKVAEGALILHPLTTCFRTPTLPENGTVTRDGRKRSVKVTRNQLRSFFTLCMVGSSTMGLPGTIHLPDMIMRGFPDPLTSYLSFISELVPKIMDPRLASIIATSGHMSINRMTEYAKLVEDPVSINHDAPTHGLNEIRQLSRDFLMNTTLAANTHLKSLFTLLDRQREKEFYDALCSAEELDVKVLHEVAGASLFGYTNGIASRIDQTRTVRALNETVNVMKRLADAEARYIAYLFARDIHKHDLIPDQCSRVTADRYRYYSWKKKVLGVTVPHPIEMCQVTSATQTAFEDAVICWSDNLSGSRIYTTMGLGKIYQGSYTKERFKATDIAAAYGNEDILTKAVRLQKLINWRYDEGSSFARIIQLALRAITDASTDGFHRSKEEIKGEFDHRRGISGDISGGIPNFLVTPTSHFSCTTSSWISHSRGGKNENIHFQSVLINLLYRAMVYRGSLPGLPEMVWYSKERCSHCIIDIVEPSPERTTPALSEMPSAPNNPFAFIESVNVKLDYHHQVEIEKGMEETNLLNSEWGGSSLTSVDEAGLVLFLMLIGSRQVSESFLLLMREKIEPRPLLQAALNRVILVRKLGLDRLFPIRNTKCINLILGSDRGITACHDGFGLELHGGSWEKGIECDTSFLYNDTHLKPCKLHVNLHLQNVPLQLALAHASYNPDVCECLECRAIIEDRVSKRMVGQYKSWRCQYHAVLSFSPIIMRVHSERIIKNEGAIYEGDLHVPYVEEIIALENSQKLAIDVTSWRLPLLMHATWESILPQLYITMKACLVCLPLEGVIVDDDLALINLVSKVLVDLRRTIQVYIRAGTFSGSEINNKYDNIRLLPEDLRDSIHILTTTDKPDPAATVQLAADDTSPLDCAVYHLIWGDTWGMTRKVHGRILIPSSRVTTGFAGVMVTDHYATVAVLELAGAVNLWEKKLIDLEHRNNLDVPLSMNRVLAGSRLGTRGIRWAQWTSPAGLEIVVRKVRAKLSSISGNPGNAAKWRRNCQKVLKALMISLYAHSGEDMMRNASGLVKVNIHGTLSSVTAVCDPSAESRVQRAQFLFLKEKAPNGPFILRSRLERRINLLSVVSDLLG
uniref:RNA-directed RNA polymerase n=1 Tax=Maize mosaic virus TaxID=279896 RepID=A0A4P8XEC9_MMV|nr:polymerase [Maize mosaic nucleorhabdovirus]